MRLWVLFSWLKRMRPESRRTQSRRTQSKERMMRIKESKDKLQLLLLQLQKLHQLYRLLIQLKFKQKHHKRKLQKWLILPQLRFRHKLQILNQLLPQLQFHSPIRSRSMRERNSNSKWKSKCVSIKVKCTSRNSMPAEVLRDPKKLLSKKSYKKMFSLRMWKF